MTMLLSRRSLLAIAAVVDIALHARPTPVAAKMLASRHNLPPRHLETVLQALVRAGVLKGVRGPRGGYELARERRRITAAEIVRAAMMAAAEENLPPVPESRLVDEVVAPLVQRAADAFLASLDAVTIEELCRQANKARVFDGAPAAADFTI
jgi:Rrf2 family transcriptional regulator, iron-sulfur cluster assembly transcription factor